MYCIHCGTELIDGSCPKCAEEATGEQPKNTVACIKEKPKQEPISATVFSIVSLVTSILGLIGYGYPLACIAAIVFSVLYENKMGKGNKLTKAGRILGIIGIVTNAIAFFVYFVICYFLVLTCLILVAIGSLAA